MQIFENFRKYDFIKYSLGKYYRILRRNWLIANSEKSNFAVITDLKEISKLKGWRYKKIQAGHIQTRLPSNSLSEDTLRVVREGNKLTRQHKSSKVFGDIHRGEMYFSQLYSLVRYPVPETFICEIPDVYIHIPSGAVITEQFEIIQQSGVRGMIDDLPPIKKIPPKNTTIKGTFVSLTGYSFNNYSHWLMDIMPRLSVLGNDSINDISFVIPETAMQFHIQSLNLWGIQGKNIVPLPSGWHKLEKLILCFPSDRSSIVHSHHLFDLRDHLIAKVNNGTQVENVNRMIYISREKSRRKILNEEKLIPIVKSFGFDVVNCEDLSFIEQIKLFSGTKVILGEHGSGMNNQIFSPYGCNTIEIYNPVWLHHCILLISNILGHKHWHTFGENADIDLNITISPQKLEKLLGYVFEDENAIENVY